MTIPLGDRKGWKRWPQASPKGSRHRGRRPSLHAGAWLLQVVAWFSGLPTRTSPQHASAVPWALGQSRGQRQDQAPVWHNAGQAWLIQPPLDCTSDSGREGMGAYIVATCMGLCPSRQKHTLTLGHSASKGTATMAYLSPDCQIQQSLAYLSRAQLGSSD